MCPQPFGNMYRRRGSAKPYKGQSPFLFRLPPPARAEWVQNDVSSSISSPTVSAANGDRYPPSQEGRPVGVLNSREAKLDTKVVRRSDMPVIRKRDFGAMSLASEAARTSESKREALGELHRDMYARTSTGPREALLATWEKFHVMWYGREVPAFPLTENKLLHVTALFKAGGYRSYKNYLSRAKDFHVMSGYPWTDLLQRVAQKCSRSAQRGLAGPSRSEPFDLLSTVKAVEDSQGPICDGGPRHIAPLIVCATFFMLREIEASGIQVVDVTFDERAVTISLPVSKVDWRAKGTRRTWQCICDSYPVCPFHVLKHHAGKLDLIDDQAPFFPSTGGTFCTKDGVTATIRHAAELAGQQTRDASGSWLISGHTFRITGARTLAVLGLDAITIQLLGRWGSDAVLSYLAEAPLTNLGEKLRPPLNERRLNNMDSMTTLDIDGKHNKWVQAELMLKEHFEQKSQLEQLQNQVRSLMNSLEDMSHKVQGLAEVTSRRSPLEEWRVDNEASMISHKALVSLAASPSVWTTMCGWKFAGKAHAVTYRLEEDAKYAPDCKKCPKCHKHTNVSSASSTDSSSED